MRLKSTQKLLTFQVMICIISSDDMYHFMALIKLVLVCSKFVVNEFVSHQKLFTKRQLTWVCFLQSKKRVTLSQFTKRRQIMTRKLQTTTATFYLWKNYGETYYFLQIGGFFIVNNLIAANQSSFKPGDQHQPTVIFNT